VSLALDLRVSYDDFDDMGVFGHGFFWLWIHKLIEIVLNR